MVAAAVRSLVVAALLWAPPACAAVVDIPIQSLRVAIDAFCNATGTEVYYDGAAAEGLYSAAVNGDFAHDEALRRLLAGTELVALKAGANGYLLIHPGDDAARAIAVERMARDSQFQRYFAIMQDDIQRILCQNPEAWPVSYRSVVRLWIDPTGVIQRIEANGATGEHKHDRQLVSELGQTRLTEPPPQMPLPITMVVLPSAMAAASRCMSYARPAGR